MKKSLKVLIVLVVIVIIWFAATMIPSKTSKSLLQSASVDATGCSTWQARSISQFGITWYFDKCYTYGTFANGDYWIVGPAVITKITPDSVQVPITLPDGSTFNWIKNGTMVNPMPSPDNAGQGQGFDNSITKYAWYSSAKNVAPGITGKPLFAPAHTSVLSSISVSDQITSLTDYKDRIQTMAVLTVLPSAAPEGSFRPSISGNDKTIKWNKSQLNFNILKSLPPVASTPSLATVESYFEKPWQTQWEGNQVQSVSPLGNMQSSYGRDQAHLVGDALLSLHLNYTNAQKEKLYIRLVQYGLDVYGTMLTAEGLNKTLDSQYKDGFYRGSGGLNVGRKAPMVLAGLALNDPGIKEWSNAQLHKVFHEDKQTFYVTQKEVDMDNTYCHPSYPNQCNEPYTVDMIGTPEWNADNHDLRPNMAGSNWDKPYRHINGVVFVSNALGVMLLQDGRSTWNRPVFFEYTDRFYGIEKGNVKANQNYIQPFAANMWNAYRNLAGEYNPPVTPTGYTLSISSTGGVVTKSPNKTYYTSGEGVTLTASANGGYQFSGWSGACSGTSTTCTITMDANKSVTASFVVVPVNPETLHSSSQTYTHTGTQSVEIAVDDSKITNALTVSAKVMRNSDTSAYPAVISDEDYAGNKGYYLGDTNSGTNNPICFRINGEAGDGAFVCEPSVVLNGSTYIHYVGVFDGTNKKIQLYRDGVLVSEKSHPSSSISIDTGIEEIGDGLNGSIKDVQIFNYVLTPSQIPNIGVVVPTTYTLTTSATNGTITRSPNQTSYTSGTSVTLTATPATGYQFSSWTGCTSTTNTCTVTMDANKTVSANFTALPQTYIISYNGNGNTGGTTPASQIKTENVNLTLATNSGNLSKTGYTFSGWNTNTGGTGTNYAEGSTYTANAGATLYAKWTLIPPPTYTLTTSASNGTITRSPNQTSYTSGTSVTLTATPNAGYQFSSWTGCTSTTNTCTVTMDANKTVSANFTDIIVVPTDPPASKDRILKISGPSSVEIGKTYDITVTYDAKAERYLTLDFKIPSSTKYVGLKAIVPQGIGKTHTFKLTIPSNTSTTSKLEYLVYLSTDGTYTTRLAIKNLSGVYAK